MTEQEVLAKTIWGEARGEGRIGQEAVASVIVNRAGLAKTYTERHGHHHPLFGDGTITAACLAKWQFSCWNEGDPNLPKMRAVTAEDRRYRQCLDVAACAQSGQIEDPTGGATNYHTIAAPKNVSTWPPKWAGKMQHTVTIGSHVFYR